MARVDKRAMSADHPAASSSAPKLETNHAAAIVVAGAFVFLVAFKRVMRGVV